MLKLFAMLHRAMLVVGVIVALTPCGLCQASQPSMGMSAQTCHMDHGMAKDGCCHHSKSQGPFCKIMNQSSVQVASHGLDLVAMPVVHFASSPAAMPKVLPLPPLVFLDTSPQRAPLSLRI